jgi:ATP-binding protein involved in chromosome partitioning
LKPNKEQILEILKTICFENQKTDIVSSNSVLNVLVFEKEIVIDLKTNNPSLQAKNKIKSQILNSINFKYNNEFNLKVNFILKKEIPKTILNSTKKLDNINNIIAISSGKGGVGKSTVTANLAVSLSKMGFNVGILDADIYGPSIPLMFNVFESKPLAVNIDGKSKMKPVESFGIKILSIGFFTKLDQAVIWRGPMASKH